MSNISSDENESGYSSDTYLNKTLSDINEDNSESVNEDSLINVSQENEQEIIKNKIKHCCHCHCNSILNSKITDVTNEATDYIKSFETDSIIENNILVDAEDSDKNLINIEE